MAGRALLQVARENPRDPVAEYLGELAWDGEPRAEALLETHLGAVGEPTYLRAVSRRWLVSLVARALRPGCKVDTVLGLEGPQGVGKSSAFEALVGTENFLDTALELGEKDTMQAVASAWLVELGELASLRGAEVGRVNQFVTSKVDRYRPPYGRVTVESPRRCVFVGTTNDDSYLRDRTGNRRFWPARVERPLPDLVVRDRDQVLAEAVAAFRAGDAWWLDSPTAALAASEAEGRLEDSAVEQAVRGAVQQTIEMVMNGGAQQVRPQGMGGMGGPSPDTSLQGAPEGPAGPPGGPVGTGPGNGLPPAGQGPPDAGAFDPQLA